MGTYRKLAKIFFDWMGVLLVIFMVALMVTGAWAPGQQEGAIGVEPVVSQSLTAIQDGHALAEGDDAAITIPVKTDGGSAALIVIDAGHGGADAGASSPNGVSEVAINLKIARLVESGLREAGFAVSLTRTDEKALGANKRADMAQRREIMRADGVAAVVSIHLNKFRDPAVRGPMAFYMKGSEQGEKLAAAVIENVCNAIGNPKRDPNPGDYFVLRESIAPAVIIECGFLSNASDEKLLQDEAHQVKLAQGIVAGIASYFSPK